MERLQRVSISCVAALFTVAVILGASIVRAYEGSFTDLRTWGVLLGGSAVFSALLCAVAWKNRIASEQRDLSLQLVSLTNNVPGAVVNLMNPMNVDTVFIAGKVKKWRGGLVGVDVACVLKLVEEARDGVIARAGFKTSLFA